MINRDFEYIIASSDLREKVTCEIYFKDEMIAQVTQETEDLILEIFPPNGKTRWEIPLAEFQKALENAKKLLIGK